MTGKKATIKELRILPPFAIGRLGSAPDPLDNYTIETEVEALKARGVTFEHYDLPELTREGDLYVGGDMKVAWFKDPDGNILSLVSG